MYYGNLLTFWWGEAWLHQVTFYVYLHAELPCPVLFCFSWRQDVFHVAESWLNSVVGRVKSYIYVWCSLMRFIQTKQHWFKNLWRVGMSTWKRQGGLALKWVSMFHAVPGQCKIHLWNISHDPSQIFSLRKLRIRPVSLNSTWRFAQETKIVCLQASVIPEDNTYGSGIVKTSCFRNALPHWRGWDLL